MQLVVQIDCVSWNSIGYVSLYTLKSKTNLIVYFFSVYSLTQKLPQGTVNFQCKILYLLQSASILLVIILLIFSVRNVMQDVTRLLYLLNKNPRNVQIPPDGMQLLNWSEEILKRYLQSQVSNKLSDTIIMF